MLAAPLMKLEVEPKLLLHDNVTKERLDFKPWRSKQMPSLPESDSQLAVVSLGTGSAIPSSFRNVSSTLLKTPSNDLVLLDCGESTIGQIQSVFGTQDEEKSVFSRLKLIFISHLHADHHLGFFSIAQRWLEIAPRNAKLIVIAPRHVLNWFKDYQKYEFIDWSNRIKFYDSKMFDYTLPERTMYLPSC